MNRKATLYTLEEIEDIVLTNDLTLTKQEHTDDYALSLAEDADDIGIFTKVGVDTYTFRFYRITTS